MENSREETGKNSGSLTNQFSSLVPKLELQEIVDHNTDYKIIANDSIAAFLFESGKIKSECETQVKGLIDKAKCDGFRQVSFAGVPLLVLILKEEKELRLYSPRLGFELFWLHTVDSSHEKLKGHVDKFLNLYNSDERNTVIEQVTHEFDLPDFTNEEKWKEIESRESELRSALLVHLNHYRPSLFERVSNVMLSLSASFALIRVHLLKFLAVLPSLDYDQSGKEVKRVWLESLRRLAEDNLKAKLSKAKGQNRALPLSWSLCFQALGVISQLIPQLVLSKLIRFSVRLMAKRFIAGENIKVASGVFKSLAKTKRDVTLDQLGELVVSDQEADHYKDKVLELVRGMKYHYRAGERNSAGILKAHISIKVSALCSDFKAEAFDYTYENIAPRLTEILIEAKKNQVFINIDAEHYHHRDTVFEVYKKVLLECEDLRDYKDTGIVLQAYLRDAVKHLKEIQELAKERNLIMPIRLVKGAYWDAETIEAKTHSENAPQFLNKEETDLHFRQIAYKILEAKNELQLTLASHNFSDHSFAKALKDKLFKDSPEIEHQCLHMTYEALSLSLSHMGWATRNYVPIGSLIVGMAYLVRRIMENSSQVGVLTIMRSHKKANSLSHPRDVFKKNKSFGHYALDESVIPSEQFFNYPIFRSYLEDERKGAEDALKNFSVIDYTNSKLEKESIHNVYSPSDKSELVGRINFLTVEQCTSYIERANECFKRKDWQNLGMKVRSGYLVKAAHLMGLRRNEFSALIMKEAGKTLNEAYADVDEAIDFLNFYARSALSHTRKFPESFERGPVAVISPWNFPLAIPCGMVAAPLVMGNPVLLKSAEQTPIVAEMLIRLFHEVGVPREVLTHVPGDGETVGDTLVKSPHISTIVFTGSKAVGTHIAHVCSKRLYENPLNKKQYPVKVITEMGGKNAVIVTPSAELDETVAGILYSAFAHSGQKCSAASRVIVDKRVKPVLVQRLKEAIENLPVGNSTSFGTTLNPVITEEDQKRLFKMVELAKEESVHHGGKVWADRSQELKELNGHFVGPVLIELPLERAKHPQSYAQKEFFGPVIHLMTYTEPKEALRLFNSSSYGLTGGIFAQSQDDVDIFLPYLESGNLYINRSITGARVAIEPFGGFKLSGTGPKAGHPHYIKSFNVFPFEENVIGEKMINVETGSDYELDLCSASQLKTKERMKRIKSFAKEFERNFESFYQGIYGDKKKDLSDFFQFLYRDYERFISSPWNNRVIPGQESYNLLTLPREKNLLISYEWRPYLSSLISAFLALASGGGLTVLTRSEKSYAWWNSFLSMARKSGFSTENFDVYFVSEKILKTTVSSRDYQNLIFDGRADKLHEIQKLLNVRSPKDWFGLVHILCPQDAADIFDYEKRATEFFNVRSVANNTMRHGAPLELDF
ncbi:MAG: bifunctional proline dehydrogenase/L-glutamate gamma-semialdehyde dehydrogenase [Bacteriovoracaceae bacterium]